MQRIKKGKLCNLMMETFTYASNKQEVANLRVEPSMLDLELGQLDLHC